MKNPVIKIMSMLVMFALLLASCGGGGSADRVRQEQLNEIKESTSESLHDLLHDIEERIEIIEEQMEHADGELEAQLEESRDAVKEQKEIIENEMAKIDEATLDTWNDVIESSSATIAQVRSEINEISRKVRDLIEE